MRAGPGLGGIGSPGSPTTSRRPRATATATTVFRSSLQRGSASRWSWSRAFEIAERYRTPVDDPGRWDHGSGDGACIAHLPHAATPRGRVGPDRRRRSPAARVEVDPPPARGAGGTRSTPPGQVPRDREPGGALRDRTPGRCRPGDRGLRDRGPRRSYRDRACTRARRPGRAVQADQPAAVPRGGLAKACPARCAVSLWSSFSSGQMLEDVRLSVQGRCPVAFHGRIGGIVPTPDGVLDALLGLAAHVGSLPADLEPDRSR